MILRNPLALASDWLASHSWNCALSFWSLQSINESYESHVCLALVSSQAACSAGIAGQTAIRWSQKSMPRVRSYALEKQLSAKTCQNVGFLSTIFSVRGFSSGSGDQEGKAAKPIWSHESHVANGCSNCRSFSTACNSMVPMCRVHFHGYSLVCSRQSAWDFGLSCWCVLAMLMAFGNLHTQLIGPRTGSLLLDMLQSKLSQTRHAAVCHVLL